MIIIAPLSAVPGLVASERVGHVMSLLGPGGAHPELGLAAPRHLKLNFHDITEETEGLEPPMPAHVARILDFVSGWKGEASPLLIHCWAGISRSTASAYAAMCMLHPQRDEAELAAELRAHSPVATPNRRMVAFADEMLGRKGRMTAAIDAIGRGADAFEGVVVRWPVARG